MDTRWTTPERWVSPPDEAAEAADEPALPRCVPELLQLGYQKHAEACPLLPHRHEQAYEFVYVERGNVTWEVDGVFYPTSAGQWFFTYPGERHNARFNHMEPSRIWWLIIEDPEDGAEWLRLAPPERDAVIARLRSLPRVFRSVNRTREQLTRLRATIETAKPETSLFARHQLLDILLGFFQHESIKLVEPDAKTAITLTVDRVMESPDLRMTVADMAKAASLSESHYYKIFQEIYGQSPIAYLDRARMERACDMLLTNRSVTDVALELGYKTSQHFTTVFKKLIGSSPTVWRKNNKGSVRN